MGAAENKKLIRSYFKMIATGSPKLPELLADDVVWWVPPGSDMAGTYEGKAKVLELMGSGVGLYDPSVPMKISTSHHWSRMNAPIDQSFPRYERSTPMRIFNDVATMPSAMPIMIARFPAVLKTAMM